MTYQNGHGRRRLVPDVLLSSPQGRVDPALKQGVTIMMGREICATSGRLAALAAALLLWPGAAGAELVKCGSVVDGEVVNCPQDEDECCVGNRSGSWGKYRFVNGQEVPEGSYCDLGSQIAAPGNLQTVENPGREIPVPGEGRRAVESERGARYRGGFPTAAEPPLPRDLRLPRPGLTAPRGAEALPPAVLRSAPRLPDVLVRLSSGTARTLLEGNPQMRTSYRNWYCYFFAKTDGYCQGWQGRQAAGF